MSEFSSVSDSQQYPRENAGALYNHEKLVNDYMESARNGALNHENDTDNAKDFLPPIQISDSQLADPTTLAGVGARTLLEDFDAVDIDKDGFLRKGEVEAYLKDCSKTNPLEKDGLKRLMEDYRSVETKSNDQFGFEHGASKADLHAVLKPACNNASAEAPAPATNPVTQTPAEQQQPVEPGQVTIQPIEPPLVLPPEMTEIRPAPIAAPPPLTESEVTQNTEVDLDASGSIVNNVDVIVNVPASPSAVDQQPAVPEERETAPATEEPAGKPQPKPAPAPEAEPVRKPESRPTTGLDSRYRRREPAEKPTIRRRLSRLKELFKRFKKPAKSSDLPYSETELGAQILKSNFNKIDLDRDGLLEKDEINKYRDRKLTSKLASDSIDKVRNSKDVRNRSEDESGNEDNLSRKDLELTIEHEKRLGRHDGYTTSRDADYVDSRLPYDKHEFAARVLKDNFNKINTDRGVLNTKEGGKQYLSFGEINDWVKKHDNKLEREAVQKLINDHRSPFAKGGNELLWNSHDGHSGRRGKLRNRRSRESQETKGLTEKDINEEIRRHADNGSKRGHPNR